MKNIIKITSSALIAFLALGTVAFAAPSSGTGAGTGVGSSAPSTGNGGGTSIGSTPTDGNGGGSTIGSIPSTGTGGGSGIGTDSSTNNNGGSSKSHRSSGGSYIQKIVVSNTKVSVSGNKATVTWETNVPSQGIAVYGPLSLATPTNATAFYGYAAGTNVSTASLKHSVSFTMAPGIAYYVRPVSFIGSRIVFGSESKVNRSGTVVKTAAPAAGTVFDAPTNVIPNDVEVTKTPTTASSSNVAGVNTATPKAAGFFKRIWNAIAAPFCR